MMAGCFSCQSNELDFPDERETDFFYTDKGEKEYFTIRKDKVILKTKSEVEAKTLYEEDAFTSAYNVGYWVIGTIDPKKTKLDDLLRNSDVISGTYGLEYGNGSLFYPTDEIAFKLKEGHTIEEILNAADITESVVTTELFNPLSVIYIITLDVALGDILQISRKMFETELCEFAAPPFIWELKSIKIDNGK